MLTRGAVVKWLVVSLAAVMVGLFAFGRLFTTFVPWDDEGYFLLAYREVLEGRIPYREVFSWYGAAMFLLAGVVTGWAPENVTHDGVRWVTLPLWLTIAGVMGATVWRLTRTFAPALIAFIVIGLQLAGLAKSVGHPQLWTILAGALLPFIGIGWMFRRARGLAAFLVGTILAMLWLLKINLGVFGSLAVGMTLALHLLNGWRDSTSVRPGVRYVLACTLALTGAVPGLALFMLDGTTRSEWYFASAYVVAMLTIVFSVAAQTALPRPRIEAQIYLVSGFAVCAMVVFVWVLFQGTSLKDLYDGLILNPKNLATAYHYPFLDPSRRISQGLALLGLAIAAPLAWARLFSLSSLQWGGLKAVVGAVLLLAFLWDHRMALTGSLLFLWLLVAARDPSTTGFSDRLLLALLAATFSLQLYPMAGEQADWAALLPVVAAAVLCADGMAAIGASVGAKVQEVVVPLAGAGELALVLVSSAVLIGSTVKEWSRWSHAEQLSLPGAMWLRLPSADADRLRNGTRMLKENCSAALMIPGVYSFAIWSGVTPMEQRRINAWPFLWPESIEARELEVRLKQPGNCIFVVKSAYGAFARIAVSPDHRLLEGIQGTMRPFAEIEDMALYRY